MPLNTIPTEGFTLVASGSRPIPGGVYQAVFKAFDRAETSKGEAYRWTFNVVGGEHDGATVIGFTDTESPPTPRNKMGRWLCGLIGQPPKEGVSVNPPDYIGRKYMLVMEATENGSRLQTISPLPQ